MNTSQYSSMAEHIPCNDKTDLGSIPPTGSRYCQCCESLIKGYGIKYCSKSCAAIVNNSKYPKRIKKCELCKLAPVALNSTRYCSRACYTQAIHNKKLRTLDGKIENWLNGGDIGYHKRGNLKRFIRTWCLQQAEYRCTKCGWDEINTTTGSTPLEVDHKDGDWRNCRPENLRVLCPNCHSLTATYRALNRGKGRENRSLVNEDS